MRNRMLVFIIILIINKLLFADGEHTSGTYLNLNIGGGTIQYLPIGTAALTANAGYNFNRDFALEGGYTLLASSQFGSNLTNNIFDIAAKGTIPMSDIFSLYGRLGIGINFMTWGGTAYGAPAWYCTQNNINSLIGLAGIGMSFKLSEHFDLRLEDTLYVPFGTNANVAGNTNLLLGGAQFNF